MGGVCDSERGGVDSSPTNPDEASPSHMPSSGGTKLGDLLHDGEVINPNWDHKLPPKRTSEQEHRYTNANKTLTLLPQMLAPLEERLRQCSEESLTTLRQILDNVTANPWEEKFRVLYAIKPKIRNMLSCPGCAQLLLERAGFLRRERDTNDQEQSTITLCEALRLDPIPSPDWLCDEGEPFSVRSILVLPLDSCIQKVHTARVTVNSCIQEKLTKNQKSQKLAPGKASSRTAVANEEQRVRDRIKQQIRENQESLHEKTWFKSSQGKQIVPGAKMHSCDALGITHKGGSIEPPKRGPGG